MSNTNGGLKVNEIPATPDMLGAFQVLEVTQEEYDIMKFHDPHTVYYTDEHRSYIGDMLMDVKPIRHDNLYMGVDEVDGKIYYTVSMIKAFGMIEIERFNNPNDAINRIMAKYRSVPAELNRGKIKQLVINLVDETITPGEFMIQLLCEAGYKYSQNLQAMIMSLEHEGRGKSIRGLLVAYNEYRGYGRTPATNIDRLYKAIYACMWTHDINEAIGHPDSSKIESFTDNICCDIEKFISMN